METCHIIYYIALFGICLTLGYTLCRTFASEAKVYLQRRFNGDDNTANSLLRLFRVGFWLLHASIGLFVIIQSPYMADAMEVVEQLGIMVGCYTMLMAFYHYLLIRVLYQVKA